MKTKSMHEDVEPLDIETLPPGPAARVDSTALRAAKKEYGRLRDARAAALEAAEAAHQAGRHLKFNDYTLEAELLEPQIQAARCELAKMTLPLLAERVGTAEAHAALLRVYLNDAQELTRNATAVASRKP